MEVGIGPFSGTTFTESEYSELFAGVGRGDVHFTARTFVAACAGALETTFALQCEL